MEPGYGLDEDGHVVSELWSSLTTNQFNETTINHAATTNPPKALTYPPELLDPDNGNL